MRLAQLNIPQPPSMSGFRFTNPSSLPSDITTFVLQYAIAGAGFVFLIMVISAGYKYMTSLGEPASIQAATKQLLHALTGLLVVITAFFLIQIIQTIFGLNII